jgi:hypothetical protein
VQFNITILNTALNVAIGRFFLLAVLFAFDDIAEVMFVKLPLHTGKKPGRFSILIVL